MTETLTVRPAGDVSVTIVPQGSTRLATPRVSRVSVTPQAVRFSDGCPHGGAATGAAQRTGRAMTTNRGFRGTGPVDVCKVSRSSGVCCATATSSGGTAAITSPTT